MFRGEGTGKQTGESRSHRWCIPYPCKKFYRRKGREGGNKQERKGREEIACQRMMKYTFWKKIPPGIEDNIT